MKVKGTAVRVLPDYIKKYYADIYNTWLESLPQQSYEIFSQPIFASEWFDMYLAHAVPTIKLADLLSKEPTEVARDVGRYSAESALKGVYSIFLKIASLKYAIQRVPQFFTTYYEPAYVEMLDKTEGNVRIKFGYTTEQENLLYYRNTGWIERFLELAFNPLDLDVQMSIHQKEDDQNLYFCLFHVKWTK